jgi:hypothetical protein
MSRIANLNTELTKCCEQLVECAAELKDLRLLKEESAIYKIGKAIAEINEVRSDIYKINPELKPDLWDKPPTEEHYEEWFNEAKNVAEEYINEGKPEKAVSTFESFIFIGPPESIVAKAREEIERVRKEYGV